MLKLVVQVKSLEEIQHLEHLKDLRVLWLCDNPCADEPDYRARFVLLVFLRFWVGLANAYQSDYSTHLPVFSLGVALCLFVYILLFRRMFW